MEPRGQHEAGAACGAVEGPMLLNKYELGFADRFVPYSEVSLSNPCSQYAVYILEVVCFTNDAWKYILFHNIIVG